MSSRKRMVTISAIALGVTGAVAVVAIGATSAIAGRPDDDGPDEISVQINGPIDSSDGIPPTSPPTK